MKEIYTEQEVREEFSNTYNDDKEFESELIGYYLNKDNKTYTYEEE